MMNIEEVRKKIREEFDHPLNPTLETEFSNLEFGGRILFSDVKNIKPNGENSYTFDVAVPYRKYYMRCYYDTSKRECITSVEYLPGIALYLNVTSPELTYDQLSSMLALKPTSGWSIGDDFRNGKSSRKFSSVKYNASFDDYVPIEVTLREFVSTLARSAHEIKALSQVANVRIMAATWSHISKVDGFVFCEEIFKKMSELEISFDYDPYVYQN